MTNFNSNDSLGYLGLNQPEQPVFLGSNTRAPTSLDVYPAGTQWQDNSNGSTPVLYITTGSGRWLRGGDALASTTNPGIVEIATYTELSTGAAPAEYYVGSANDVYTYVNSVVTAGAPVATETTAGIGELATDAEAIAGTPSTGALALFVTPSNLTPVFAEPPAIGGTTAAAATFTDLTADGTGAVSLGSATAGDFTVAAGDLTIEATTGSAIINAEEAVDDAIQITSLAGGLSASVALSAVIATTETNADSMQLTSAGGLDITATGAAGKDIDVVCTSGSINFTAGENVANSMVFTNKGFQVATTGAAGQDISLSNTGGSITLLATENAAQNIYLHANGGASETIQLHADQGTGDTSVYALSDAGGVTLSGGKAAATAVNILAPNGGVTMTVGADGILPSTTGAFTVVSTKNAAQAIELHANGGTSETIRIRSDQGTATTSLDLLSDVGGITLNAGLAAANSIVLEANSAGGGGIDVNVGTAGMTIDTTGALSLDAAGASNFTTSSGDLSLISSAGSVVVNGAEAAVDAIQLTASDAAGGVDINAGTGGITVDSTGAISIDAAAASNLTVTGASADLTVSSSGGSVIITGTEAAVDAVQINGNTGAGGVDINAGTGGLTIDSGDLISIDAAAASNFTVTGAADLTLQSTAGAVNVISGETNADSINVTSAGGMNIVATGAAAKDVVITCTSGSMSLTAGENVTDAINITASGAASRVNVSAGTGSINLDSGLIVSTTSLSNADTPYTVLGTDYFLACDTGAGVLQVTLPAATAVAGRTYVIRDVGGSASASNITINGGGTNLVGGGAAAATKVLSADYSGATVYSDGTVWSYCYVA